MQGIITTFFYISVITTPLFVMTGHTQLWSNELEGKVANLSDFLCDSDIKRELKSFIEYQLEDAHAKIDNISQNRIVLIKKDSTLVINNNGIIYLYLKTSTNRVSTFWRSIRSREPFKPITDWPRIYELPPKATLFKTTNRETPPEELRKYFYNWEKPS